MPKTINWPKEFQNEIIKEAEESIKIAIRPGTLYKETHYYTKGEIVDIRAENIVIRKAMVFDELKVSKIDDITQPELNLLKKTLQTKESIIEFLSNRYNICANKNTEVTLITYKNLALEELDENDDPHFN